MRIDSGVILAFSKSGCLLRTKSISPAVVALLVQAVVALLLASALLLCWQLGQIRFSFPEVLLSQSLLTLLATRWLGLAWWWCVIQPLFPVALAGMMTLALPSWLYLMLFLALLLIYWSTYRTQVPYYPSTRSSWLALEQLLPQARAFSFVDIGSGLGGLVLHLGKKYPLANCSGVEVAPLPWLISILRQKLGAASVRFLWSSYERLDFSKFDVVFAYLSPAAMDALWRKASAEMRPGSQLVSFEFPVVGVPEAFTVAAHKGPDHGHKLYVWTF